MKLEGKDRHGKKQSIRKTALNDDLALRKSGQGHHEVRLVDTPQYQKKIEWIFDKLKQGLQSNEIFALMLMEEPDLGEQRFLTLLNKTYQFAKVELQKDREYMFTLHMDRYERIFHNSMQMLDSWNRPLDPVKDWHIMTARYYNAIKALKSKEELLGLHDKSVVIEFNDNKAIVAQQKPNVDLGHHVAGFDLEKLSLQETVELLQLIKESRTVPIEGEQRVIIKTTTIEITTGSKIENLQQVSQVETRDVEFEEMPDEVVSKIQDITPEVEKLENENIGPIVIDTIREKIKRKHVEIKMDEIAKEINNPLLKKFSDRLKQQAEQRRKFDSGKE